jgi:hypothetical protein
MTRTGAGHPDEGDLLRYLDSELPEREAKDIQAHLAACWQCRIELEEVQQAVGECVRYRRDVLGSCFPDPPAPWFDIYRRMAASDGATEAPRLVTRITRLLRLAAMKPMPWAATAAMALIVWAAADYLRPHREPVKIAARSEAAASPAPASTEPAPARPRARPIAKPVLEPQVQPATPGDELRVFAVLRRLNADLGEPVEVNRTDTEVSVTGVGVRPDLRQQIRAELQVLPRVNVRFSDPSAGPPLPVTPAGSDVSLRTEIAQLQAEIEKNLGGRALYEGFTADVLETSDALISRVHALRRLAHHFQPEAESLLGAGERQLLKRLRGEHAAAIVGLAAALDGRCRPALEGFDAAGTAAARPAQSGAWQDAAEVLFGHARQVETLLAAALGGAGSQVPAEHLPKRILSSLAQLRADAEDYARRDVE